MIIRVLECVPNFSEGRDSTVVRAIADAIAQTPDVLLLGWESDTDHNRSVMTFAGPADAVIEGAVRGAGKAAELIDLSAHVGVHPRVGAADVIPFIPLDGATMDADQRNAPISVDTYYIVPNKCTECQGFHEEPQCAAVCPVDCCVPDEMYQETVDELLAKKEKLHI